MTYKEALVRLEMRINPAEFAGMLYQQLDGECEHCQLSVEGFDRVMMYIAEHIAEDEAKEAK